MKVLLQQDYPLRKPLSGVRKILFLAIATQPGITKAQLCALSRLPKVAAKPLNSIYGDVAAAKLIILSNS
ncbi:MAG: hypothetical protein WA865_06155 [Spirulinaceae cyanobacterium]